MCQWIHFLQNIAEKCLRQIKTFVLSVKGMHIAYKGFMFITVITKNKDSSYHHRLIFGRLQKKFDSWFPLLIFWWVPQFCSELWRAIQIQPRQIFNWNFGSEFTVSFLLCLFTFTPFNQNKILSTILLKVGQSIFALFWLITN